MRPLKTTLAVPLNSRFLRLKDAYRKKASKILWKKSGKNYHNYNSFWRSVITYLFINNHLFIGFLLLDNNNKTCSYWGTIIYLVMRVMLGLPGEQYKGLSDKIYIIYAYIYTRRYLVWDRGKGGGGKDILKFAKFVQQTNRKKCWSFSKTWFVLKNDANL